MNIDENDLVYNGMRLVLMIYTIDRHARLQGKYEYIPRRIKMNFTSMNKFICHRINENDLKID
jgi:hypothetical protein